MSTAALPPTARHAMETMANRLRSIRMHAEKAGDRATVLGVSAGTALAFGYVNEAYGAAPAADPGGLKEYTILKVPVDMAVAGASLATLFLNGFGKYDLVGLGVATGAGNAVLYRMGVDFARKHAKGAATTKTSGQFGVGAREQPWTAREQAHAAYT